MSRFGEMVHLEVENGVTYRVFVEQDEMGVRGNAFASGDDAEDKEVEDAIIARLESGDVWAWAQVTVEASFKGISGRDFLGGCCYADTAEFIAFGGYYDDMKRGAFDDLLASAKQGHEAYAELKLIAERAAEVAAEAAGDPIA